MIRKRSKKGGKGANLTSRPAKEEANRPTKCTNKWRRTKKEHFICNVRNLKVSNKERRLGNSREQTGLRLQLNSKRTLVRYRSPYTMTTEIFQNNFRQISA